MMRRFLHIFGLFALLGGPCAARDAADRLSDLQDRFLGGRPGCLVTTDRTVNGLIWEDVNGGWMAVVANDNPSPSSSAGASPSAVDPCWSGTGQCAVYIGTPPGEAACVNGQPNLRSAVRSNVMIFMDPTAAGVDGLGRLARGLKEGDTMVSLNGDAAIWMHRRSDGALGVRIETAGQIIRIAAMRDPPESLDIARLVADWRALGSVDLDAAGPLGVATDARAIASGVCFELSDASETRSRLEMAESVLPMSGAPAPGAEAERAFADLLFAALGWVPGAGSSPHFAVDQDPRIYIARTGVAISCP